MVERTLGFQPRLDREIKNHCPCSNFASSHGGRVGALWTIVVDHSSRGETKAIAGG